MRNGMEMFKTGFNYDDDHSTNGVWFIERTD